MNNYEVVYVDEQDIGQAIDFIDIDSMAEHIYFGPQAEIMEKLNRFNQRNNFNLSVTKTFRWSPGTYDKIAEMMMRKVGLRRRASGMYNYLSREEYNWGPGRQSVQHDLREMDNIITQLRYQGVQWLEDPSILIERKETFKNYICEKFEGLLELIGKMDKITVLNVLLEQDGSATTRSSRLVINLCLHPGEVQIYNANNGGTPTHVQNLPAEMDLLVKIEMYPLAEMVNERLTRFNVHTYGRAESYDDRGRLYFPYISRTDRRSSWNSPEGYGSICYGDDSTDINRALNNFELPAYAMLLVNWMNRYTQNTNPYNNIKTLYHGEPKWLNDDYRVIFGTNSWDACTYTPSGHDDYCDTNECALRHQCEYYKQAYPEPVTPEQAEQLTLQWATRMGGVGVNANQPQGDREQDHYVNETGIDPGALREELERQAEEDRINAAMDAEESDLEAYQRAMEASIESELNNSEEE